MVYNKYIISLTTIPSRINNIDNTIKSLLDQTLKPEKIILNIPNKYNLRFNLDIDKNIIDNILKKYNNELLIVNYIDYDYGPGTKLLGLIKSNIIKLSYFNNNNVYIVLVDDDHIYKSYMIEYFDNYNKKKFNNKLNVASFYCYNLDKIKIAQGADGFFIRYSLLDKFSNYYNIIKNYDYINYHDDYYISYYFYIRKIQIEYIEPPYNLIYIENNNLNKDDLINITGKYNRNDINYNIHNILNLLYIEGKFNNIKNNNIKNNNITNSICYFYSYSNIENVYSLSFPIIKKYCNLHNYSYEFYHDNIEYIYKPHWNKILYGIKLLEKKLDVEYFIWVDHDIIIKNFNIKIDELIERYNFKNNNANFMMSEDPISKINFNTGIVIFKNNNDSLNIFKKLIDIRNNLTKYLKFKKYHNHDFHKKGSLQDTLTFLLYFSENPNDLLSVPHKILQSFYPAGNQYQLGDFCGHVAGPQGDELIQYMKNLINMDTLNINTNICSSINYSEYTMVNNKHITQIQSFVRYINENNIEGCIVECGVWKGGIMMACMNEQKKYNQNREFYLYDTYDGFTEPKNEKDLLSDKIKYKELTDKGLKWHKIDLECVKKNISLCNYDYKKINYIKGDVLETLNYIFPEKISILRLDTDWYDLTKKELNVLYNKVSHKGFVIIDDYNNIDTNGNPRGARVACNEFFEIIKNEIIELEVIKTNSGLDEQTIPYCFQRCIKTNKINSNNCIIITTTLTDNNISEMRKKNIIDNLQEKYNFDINFINGTKYKKWEKNEQFESTLNMLEKFKSLSNYEYGIICQDDFYPIDNFLEELNKTIELLPSNWECLHLCPGFLWGRKFRDKSKIGKLNPEYNMSINDYNYDISGRFFINIDSNKYINKNMWLGGPIAFIIKHSYISKFIIDYKNNYDNDDRTLTKILNNNTYICREPQLGYEEECGGTSAN